MLNNRIQMYINNKNIMCDLSTSLISGKWLSCSKCVTISRKN